MLPFAYCGIVRITNRRTYSVLCKCSGVSTRPFCNNSSLLTNKALGSKKERKVGQHNLIHTPWLLLFFLHHLGFLKSHHKPSVGKTDIVPCLRWAVCQEADADERTLQRAVCFPDLSNLLVKAYRTRWNKWDWFTLAFLPQSVHVCPAITFT